MTIIQQGMFGTVSYYCERCGRTLSNPISMAWHKGPVCRAKSQRSDVSKNESEDIQLGDPIENGIVFRRINGQVATNVPHTVTHHSPSGFEFGYAGSGPADTALNVCEMILHRIGFSGRRTKCFDGDCFALAYQMHQPFKFQFIATLSHDNGGCIPYQLAEDWVKRYTEEHEDEWAWQDA